MLTLCGVLLIGLSVWSTATTSVDANGSFQAKFESLQREVAAVKNIAESNEQDLKRVHSNVAQVTEASRTVSLELSKVAQAQSVNSKNVNQLNEALAQRKVVAPDVADRVRTDLQRLPAIDIQKLEGLSRLRAQ